jgi:hypothetical protein
MKKKWNTVGWLLSGVVLATVTACGSGGDNRVNSPEAAPATTEISKAVPKARILRPQDVKVNLKITSKECFGEAGCSVAWKIDVHVNPNALKEGVDYDVTYEVRGVKDGPITDTFTLYGDGTYDSQRGAGTTPSRDAKPVTTVTEVNKRGL